MQTQVELQKSKKKKKKKTDEELPEYAVLTNEQKKALLKVRKKAKKASSWSFYNLWLRFWTMGYTKEQLKKTLDWIEHEAHVIIHVDLTDYRVLPLLQDTHYRNQFETKTSHGRLDIEKRTRWEDNLFSNIYHDSLPHDRVKYGTLNLVGDIRGLASCAQYGSGYFILKKEVRKRCTCTDSDSSRFDEIGTLDYYCHILNECSRSELHLIVRAAILAESNAAQGTDLTEFHHLVEECKWLAFRYREVQIHGPILLERDIEALVVPQVWKDVPKVEKAIQKFSNDTGCKVVWFDAPIARYVPKGKKTEG